jgi:hypothetical protein
VNNEMVAFSRKFAAAIVLVTLAKVLITVFLIPVRVPSDFFNWVQISSSVFGEIQQGRMPSIEAHGPYTGMGAFLAPFYGIWSALSMAISLPQPVSWYLLIFFMKLPIILFDLFAGVLVYLIGGRLGSRIPTTTAFFLWYLNPYAFYLMEYNGTFDIVSTAFVLFAIFLGMRKAWLSAGLMLSIATMLRVYPIFTFPFFALYALKEKPARSLYKFLAAFLLPVAIVLLTQPLALVNFVSAMSSRPIEVAYMLQYFEGIPRDSTLPSTFFLSAVQILLAAMFWRRDSSLANLVLASLLVLLTTTYHEPYHFTWLIPLLTIYYAVNRPAWTLLFVSVFATAYLALLGYNTPLDSILYYLEAIFAGAFYGIKAVYVAKVNLESMRPNILSPQWQQLYRTK